MMGASRLRLSGCLGTTTCCLLLAAALTAVPVSGQWSVGAQAGMSVADFTGSTTPPHEPAVGVAAGLVATRHLVAELSFQSDLLYVQKGTRLTADVPGRDGDAVVRLEYIDLVAMLRLDLPLYGEKLAVHAFAGPSAGLNVNCSVSTSATNAPATHECDEPGFDAGAGSFDFSMVGGGGLSTRLGSATPFVNARLAIGLNQIDDADAAWQRANGALVILAGFTLPVPTRTSADRGR